MQIILTSSSVQFRSPQPGVATKAIQDHYVGRRVSASVDGEDRMFRFTAAELAFTASEEDIIAAIQGAIQSSDDEPADEDA